MGRCSVHVNNRCERGRACDGRVGTPAGRREIEETLRIKRGPAAAASETGRGDQVDVTLNAMRAGRDNVANAAAAAAASSTLRCRSVGILARRTAACPPARSAIAYQLLTGFVGARRSIYSTTRLVRPGSALHLPLLTMYSPLLSPSSPRLEVSLSRQHTAKTPAADRFVRCLA